MAAAEEKKVQPDISALSKEEASMLKATLNRTESSVTKEKLTDTIRYCNWVTEKVNIHLLANRQEQTRFEDQKKLHPVRPRRGEVYLTQLGQNIGKEINDQHLVVIMQNNKANIFSNTIVVIPISSSGKLYDGHEKIEGTDIKNGRLDKLPSKVKTEQIQFIDKARLIHKVAEFTDEAVDRISMRLGKTLDLK